MLITGVQCMGVQVTVYIYVRAECDFVAMCKAYLDRAAAVVSTQPLNDHI